MIDPAGNPDPYAVENKTKNTEGAGAPDPGPSPTRFSARSAGGAEIITFQQSEVLDAYEIEKLGDDIYHHIRAIDAPKLVLDLGNVVHLSSAALGMLVALRKVVVEKKGGGLAIANVNKDLRSVFEMTRLDKLLGLYDSTDEAARKLR